MTDRYLELSRTSARVAGPLAGLAFVANIALFATLGEDVVAAFLSPAAHLANAVAVGALVCFLVGVSGAGSRVAADDRALDVAVVLMLVGTGLVLGAQWTQTLVLPAIARVAPAAVVEPHTPIVAGFVLSHLVLAIGTIVYGLRVRRLGRAASWKTALLVVGGLVALLPLPSRYFLVALAMSALAVPREPAIARQSSAAGGRR
jgi:hypothetical protein